MSQNNNKQASHKVRQLAASVVRRAPMDATNVLLNEADHVVSAVLREIEPRLVHKILRHFPTARSELIKDSLPEPLGEQLERNLSYPDDTVGRLMADAACILNNDITVQKAVTIIREMVKKNVVFTYAYVIDESQRLQGVVVMRDLLLAEPNEPITDIMVDDPFWFTPETSIQDAMLEVVHRHYPAYPVCDENGKFIGRVQGYELFEEHTIDVSAQPGLMVGVDDEEHFGTPVKQCFRNRHPWLQLNLLTAFIAAFVVSMFEETIASIVVLAAFLPVLAGQSGNTGCQALAVTLRGMTLGEFKQGSENTLIIKELKLGAINGALVGVIAALGMLAFAAATNTPSGYILAGVVFLAMLGSCMASGIAGVLIPIALKRFGADPATASTIFLTTATDVLSMGLLLGLATLLVL